MDIIDTEVKDIIEYEEEESFNKSKVNGKAKYFPNCVCWSTIPILTWLLPVAGHAAISDPNGWIFDFQSSYSIGKHRQTTCFGPVRKYLQLDMNCSEEEYTKAIENSNEKFSHLTHNLIVQNCHDHVCEVLNEIGYLNKRNWNTMSLIFVLMFKSKYVSAWDAFVTYLPFIICLALLIGFIVLLVMVA